MTSVLFRDTAIIHSCENKKEFNGCLAVVKSYKEDDKAIIILVKNTREVIISKNKLLLYDDTANNSAYVIIHALHNIIHCLRMHSKCPSRDYIFKQSEQKNPDCGRFLQLYSEEYPEQYEMFSQKMGLELRRAFLDIFRLTFEDIPFNYSEHIAARHIQIAARAKLKT